MEAQSGDHQAHLLGLVRQNTWSKSPFPKNSCATNATGANQEISQANLLA